MNQSRALFLEYLHLENKFFFIEFGQITHNQNIH